MSQIKDSMIDGAAQLVASASSAWLGVHGRCFERLIQIRPLNHETSYRSTLDREV
jgi:hypothetical protein